MSNENTVNKPSMTISIQESGTFGIYPNPAPMTSTLTSEEIVGVETHWDALVKEFSTDEFNEQLGVIVPDDDPYQQLDEDFFEHQERSDDEAILWDSMLEHFNEVVTTTPGKCYMWLGINGTSLNLSFVAD